MEKGFFVHRLRGAGDVTVTIRERLVFRASGPKKLF